MLTEYIKGRELLLYYEEANPKPAVLSETQAQCLVNTIMQWAGKHRKKFGKAEFIYLSKEIVNIFGCEEIVCLVF